MTLWDDRRGQALQVGAVILLAFVVLAIATYQAQVVPDQNRRAEYEHNREVQRQLLAVRNGIVSVPGGGSGRSQAVTLGTTYRARTLFVNPRPPSGQVRTTPPATVTVDNASAPGEVGDFWNGSSVTYLTRAMVYDPDYNRYQEAPVTVYENTVLYDRYPSGVVVDTDQRLVHGRSITVVTLAGDFQAAGTATDSVDISPISTSTRSVAVHDSGGPLTVAVPTMLDNGTWAELLEPEYVRNGGHVVGHRVVPGPGDYDRLVVELEPGVTYELTMAKVGVGEVVETQQAAYLVDIAGDGETVRPGEGLTLVAEVRDAYNNPVAGVELRATTAAGTVTPADASDARGRATFEFSSLTPGTHTVTVRIRSSSSAARTVTFTVTVEPVSGNPVSRLPDEITYVDGQGADRGDLKSYDPATDSVTTYPTTGAVAAVGPKEADFDADGRLEVPYVNGSGDVLVVDETGDIDTVASRFGAAPKSVSVGDVDGDGAPEVVFVSSSGNRLRQADLGDRGISNLVTEDGGMPVGATAVAGFEDFDADGTKEIVYVDRGGNLEYLDDGTVQSVGVGLDTRAVGQPADLDDDGDLDIPFVNASDEIVIVDANGNTQSVPLNTFRTAETPLATIDDPRGKVVAEVGYVGTNGRLRHLDTDPDGTPGPLLPTITTTNEFANETVGTS